MTVHRFNHCQDSLELHEGELCAEWTENHGLQIIVEYEQYNSYGPSSLAEKYLFLRHEEACELRDFLNEQIPKEKPVV